MNWALLLGFALLAGRSNAQLPPGNQKSGGETVSGQSEQGVRLRARAMAATQNYLKTIAQDALAYGVDACLIMAVITAESDGDPNCLSHSGAMGLMQLMPSTCIDYHVDQPFDPDSNIRGGTAMLANHFRRYNGDLQKVLAAYNAGIRHADDGSWVNISETRHYVPTVIAIYQALKGSADLNAFTDLSKIPTLPPEQNIDSTPIIPAEDLMLQALRWAPNVSDPAGLVEDSHLADAAADLLNWYQAGRVTDGNLQKLAIKATTQKTAKDHLTPKSLKAFCITTADINGFADKWNTLPRTDGTRLGLAHGRSGSGHVWIVIVGKD